MPTQSNEAFAWGNWNVLYAMAPKGDAYEKRERNTEEEMELTAEICSERTDPLQFLLAQPPTVEQ